MEYRQPDCLNCPLLKSVPKTIGGKAVCTAYPNSIPKSIFFEGKVCTRKPKSTPKRKTTTKRK